jgi:UDP-glucose 4-epimerase
VRWVHGPDRHPDRGAAPGVGLGSGHVSAVEAQWQADPPSEWTPTWEYGQFVDVRDVADAVQRALDVPLAGHHRMLLCAAGIAATEPSLIMAGRFAPSVPVRDAARFQDDHWRSLFDCSAAARVLGWLPRYRWPTPGDDQAG